MRKILQRIKFFWQIIKPCLSENLNREKKITLTENKNFVSDDAKVSNCLYKFFSNIVKNF